MAIDKGRVEFFRCDGGWYVMTDHNVAELGSIDVVVVGGRVFLPAPELKACPACGSEDFIECDLCRLLAESVPACDEKADRAHRLIERGEARRRGY